MALLNHLIGLDEHMLWDHKTDLLRGLQTDENLESLMASFTGKSRRFSPFQDVDDVFGGASV